MAEQRVGTGQAAKPTQSKKPDQSSGPDDKTSAAVVSRKQRYLIGFRSLLGMRPLTSDPYIERLAQMDGVEIIRRVPGRSPPMVSESLGDEASIKATSTAIERSAFCESCSLSTPITLTEGQSRSNAAKPSRCTRTLLIMNTLIGNADSWLVFIPGVDRTCERKFPRSRL
jgi:hypothetical protein